MQNIGHLRDLVSIERRATTQDAAGEQSQAWTAIGTAWVEIITLSGRELEAAQAVRATDTHQVNLRYWPGLSAKDRLTWTNPEGVTVYYSLTQVTDVEKRHLYMQCTAIEGLTPL